MGDLEQGGFLEVGRQELQADGQALLVEAAGQAEAGDAGQAGGQGEDVLQVHGQGVVHVLAQAEGGGGGGGGGDEIHLLEGALEVLLDQGADLLGLVVVGVVVAGGQGVGAEHDAALDLGAELLATRVVEDIPHAVGLGARAVADAVEAGQVGGGFGGGEQVIDGQGVFGVGQADRLDDGAVAFEQADGFPDALLDFGLDAVGGAVTSASAKAMEVFVGHADAQAAQGGLGVGAASAGGVTAACVAAAPGQVGDGQVEGGGVERVGAGHGGKDGGDVGHAGAHHADHVQGGAKGDQAVA